MHPSRLDRLILVFDRGLRALTGSAASVRGYPAEHADALKLTDADAEQSRGLMRVNHSGEICAQALYDGQSCTARTPAVHAAMQQAAREEQEHLAWTERRLAELGARKSLLNPVWYVGSFAIGALAGLGGDRWSLGFVVETERQVEDHLSDHLDRLPADDGASLAIVRQMREDEGKHARSAQEAGAAELPMPVKMLMRLAARAMTLTSYRL